MPSNATTDYYRIDTGAVLDEAFCFLSDAPSGTEMTCFKMAKGIPIGDLYPSGATLRMSDREPGRVVPGVVGNTRGLLLVDADIKDAIEGRMAAEAEYLPVAILNHKGRVASDRHWIVNPIGTSDCADVDASEIEWFEGDVVDVEELVLDPRKIDGLPALMRPTEDPRTYLVRGDLAQALRALDVKNLVLDGLRTSAD